MTNRSGIAPLLRWTRLLALACAAAVLNLLVVGAGVGVAASKASAAILAECSSGALAGHFTVQQLESALATMPASTKQYSSCPDVIQAALSHAQRHRGVAFATGSDSSFLPTPLIVILGVVALLIIALGAVAVRRRRAG